jgi:uncharacterized surface protein with fasciclin (FAS1) repeats
MEGSKSKAVIIAIAAVVVIGGGVMLATRKDDTKKDAKTETTQQQASEKNIVQTAISDPQFSTLVTALQTAGLVDTLSGEGPFTVFAPTNEAFDKLPAGTLDALLNDPAKLKSILLYHVVSGNVKAADVVKLTSAKTVEGQDVKITVDGSTVKVNDATVTKTDIETKNGTIHVIDTVLIPPTN